MSFAILLLLPNHSSNTITVAGSYCNTVAITIGNDI